MNIRLIFCHNSILTKKSKRTVQETGQTFLHPVVMRFSIPLTLNKMPKKKVSYKSSPESNEQPALPAQQWLRQVPILKRSAKRLQAPPSKAISSHVTFPLCWSLLWLPYICLTRVIKPLYIEKRIEKPYSTDSFCGCGSNNIRAIEVFNNLDLVTYLILIFLQPWEVRYEFGCKTDISVFG